MQQEVEGAHMHALGWAWAQDAQNAEPDTNADTDNAHTSHALRRGAWGIWIYIF